MSNDYKGLKVAVYRANGHDATNGGPSSKVDGFTVVGVVREPEAGTHFYDQLPKGSQVFAASDRHPAAVLVRSNLRDGPPHLVPLDLYLSGKWTMFGGNLADYSDGRWGDLVRSFQPKAKEVGLYLTSTVAIHDRVEH